MIPFLIRSIIHTPNCFQPKPEDVLAQWKRSETSASSVTHNTALDNSQSVEEDQGEDAEGWQSDQNIFAQGEDEGEEEEEGEEEDE